MGERRALVLGATGLVGGVLLRRLLEEPSWAGVTTLGRRPTEIAHPRLTERVSTLQTMGEHADLFGTDAVFCCLGTTIRAAGSQDAFRAIDLDAVSLSASLAARAGARHFLLVSAAGANPHSRVFYSRTKGEAEAAVRGSGVPAVALLRPSLILGPRSERRPAEQLAQAVGGWLAPLMAGPLARVRPVSAVAIAAVMERLGREGFSGIQLLENEEIIRRGVG